MLVIAIGSLGHFFKPSEDFALINCVWIKTSAKNKLLVRERIDESWKKASPSLEIVAIRLLHFIMSTTELLGRPLPIAHGFKAMRASTVNHDDTSSTISPCQPQWSGTDKV